MIRTIDEQLRVDKDIVSTRGKSGLSKITFALSTEIGVDGTLAFEQHMNKNFKYIKGSYCEKIHFRSRPEKLSPADFSEDVDSTRFVRERVCGSN